jgi:hypothetical protein
MMTVEQKARQGWERMKEYQPSLDALTQIWFEGGLNLKDKAEDMKSNMKPGEFVEVCHGEIYDIPQLNSMITLLRNYGLDVGRGNCEYGFRIPLPDKFKDTKKEIHEIRKLIIFRRYK